MIKIKNTFIGENRPCFIIAEAGVNHNGNLRLAKRLVNNAKKAGANAIKFQTFKAENVVIKNADMASYQIKNIVQKKSQQVMLKDLELSFKDFIDLKDYCDQKKIIFLSTPHSFDAIDFLEDLVPAYKIGSGDITNIPTLRYIARKNKPIILGTGMSTLKEVEYAVEAIISEGNEKIIALHCTTSYPCPIEDANLNVIKTMKNNLDCLVGYSDHTLGSLASIIAVSLGAVVIEKHFTIDKNLPGPDHKASLEPDEFANMVKEIRTVEKALGCKNKKPTEEEKKIMKFVRKSIVARKDIENGSIITNDMIIFKRPGIGIKPYEFNKIIGKKALKKIKKDEIIQIDMVE